VDAAKQASRSIQAQADVPKKCKLPDEVIMMEPGPKCQTSVGTNVNGQR